MRQTDLVIHVYDYDADDADDFMGETVINLEKIMPIILQGATQNTFPIKAQVRLQ